MIAHLEKTADYKPDFVCFTEVARELGVPGEDEAWDGEPIPGETTTAVGEVARQIGTHVIVGMQERVAPDETSGGQQRGCSDWPGRRGDRTVSQGAADDR